MLFQIRNCAQSHHTRFCAHNDRYSLLDWRINLIYRGSGTSRISHHSQSRVLITAQNLSLVGTRIAHALMYRSSPATRHTRLAAARSTWHTCTRGAPAAAQRDARGAHAERLVERRRRRRGARSERANDEHRRQQRRGAHGARAHDGGDDGGGGEGGPRTVA